MFNNKEINSQFLSELSDFISNNSDKKIQSLICDLHIADIAEIIEELSIEQATYLFQLINEERSAQVLIEVEDETREHILSTLSSKEIAIEVL